MKSVVIYPPFGPGDSGIIETEMNYNTSLALWQAEATRKSNLTIADGHVYRDRECIARFDNDKHAADTLKLAGYKFTIQNPAVKQL